MRVESSPGRGTRFVIELPNLERGPKKEDECIHDS